MRAVSPAVFGLVAAIFASISASAQESSAPLPTARPLFDAMIRFCIDTGARPDAVEAAVTEAGGKLNKPRNSTDWPLPMSVTIWDYVVDGHQMTVSAGTVRDPPSGKRPEFNLNSCTIRGFGTEDASIAAIRDWVGVPSGPPDSGSVTIAQYYFQDSPRGHLPMDPNLDSTRTARADGREWTVTVIEGRSGVSVQVDNVLPAGRPI